MARTVHVVTQQHFDMMRGSVGCCEQIYRRALALLEDAPEFTFSLSQVYPLREFLKRNPLYYPKIRALLDSGRLEIIGGIESSCNLDLCRGASILRNINAGRNWLKESFEYDVQAGSFEDASGMPEQLPAMLKLSGYKFFKAGRMPIGADSCPQGNFLWRGRDGTEIRCIAPSPNHYFRGFGFPDDPDELPVPSDAMRINKIMAALLAVDTRGADDILFVLAGAGHDPPERIADIVAALNRNAVNVVYRFSTFAGYYNSLSEKFWRGVPVYDFRQMGFARFFTGGYVSRVDAKLMARRVESRLLAVGSGLALEHKTIDLGNSWRDLFAMQSQDAVSGCHTDENARYLKRLGHRAWRELPAVTAQIPWQPSLPDFQLGKHFSTVTESASLKKFGKFEFVIDNGSLLEIRQGRHVPGCLGNIVLREDSGTLWTEEYSGKKFTFIGPEKIIAIKIDDDVLTIITAGECSDYLRMWPGFTALRWKKRYYFRTDCPMIFLTVEINLRGNSTEIALIWDSAAVKSCLAEAPFSAVERIPCDCRGDTLRGDSFPALNWVATQDFVLFNRGTPAHALRDNRLETIILRSPVKRWNPLFTVTPTGTAWDNGRKRFAFLWMPNDNVLNSSDFTRLGLEFNLQPDYIMTGNPVCAGMPGNLIVEDVEYNGKLRLTIYEADGTAAHWINQEYGVNVHFKPYEIKKVEVGE